MGIFDPRIAVKPYEYEWAANYYELVHKSHWWPTEISMEQDTQDFFTRLSERDRRAVGGTLKGFTQTEVVVGDYWHKVARWFPKPEIWLMASAFSAWEGIHVKAYSFLNDTFGLTDYEAFLQDPICKDKLERLMSTKAETPEEIIKSLAIFSAFAEGVSLFSSFAILLSFKRKPTAALMGMAQQITYSVRDESLHSEAGCRLLNTAVAENPDLKTKQMGDDIYEAAHVTVKLEEQFIDQIFGDGPVAGLDPEDLKGYIRFRTDTKLGDIGYKPQFKGSYTEKNLRNMAWFEEDTRGKVLVDFFVTTPSEYASKIQFDAADFW